MGVDEKDETGQIHHTIVDGTRQGIAARKIEMPGGEKRKNERQYGKTPVTDVPNGVSGKRKERAQGCGMDKRSNRERGILGKEFRSGS